jgi:glycosyltransferase involved in cell wall biosynthesis
MRTLERGIPRDQPVEAPDAPQTASGGRAPRLRVLLLTNSVAIGGMEKHVEMIARDLDRTQAEVFAVCPEWAPIAPWVETLAQAADHSARLAPDRRYGLPRGLRDTLRLWRQVRAWRIQVMHMHLTTYGGGSLALLAARLAGVRTIILTEHLAPQEPLGWLHRARHTLLTHMLNALVCVSITNREARERHLTTPPAKTVVVNNGIDVAPFAPTTPAECAALRARLGIPEGAPVVGSVVRLEDEKGLNYLLDAMPRVLTQIPGAYLLFVGDGSLRAPLEEQASRLGIRERVLFAGFQADPRPYLSLMNAFVLPVPFGSASIGLLEAMAMRRAVIITFGGKGEAVVHGETGLRLPPRDPQALADGIIQALADPAYERRLGENARQRIEETFSSASVAHELLALYQQTQARRESPHVRWKSAWNRMLSAR